MGTSAADIDPRAWSFAQRLQEALGARNVFLFGSHVLGTPSQDSDFDFIIVSSAFEGVRPLQRPIGLRQYWREVGGRGALDLFCLTPEEFDSARGGINLLTEILPEAIDLLALPHEALST